ncbi:uncharacterized protein OGAPODRAFT_94195 [Ogataea polymorpha]|uniref:uncharacterized protein n=1 Tax=Ogataea polymorpha TaxID=460523 RepID=UPI0007F3F7C9|nr:uncharacterized protein OGAPODRAFT_94195 [Ogataea polymorpha]OBA15749.1 hypothetical protein OGAPODRAFT_94195 [Ogataea polymorpha]
MLLLVLVLVITLALVAPQLVSNLRDIGTVALEKQASISATKKPGESAVYRSVDVPHGLPLTTGLRIQTGYKIRDGILKDIWHQALQKDTVLEVGGATRSIRQINGMILHLAQQMDQHNVGPRVGLNSGLDDLHALVVLFCCFFVCDRTVVVGQNPNVDVLFERKTAGSAANVVDLDDPTYFLERPETTDYAYNPIKDYSRFNNEPYIELIDGVEYRYFQRSFVSAVASQLMSLSTAFSWSTRDRLLVVVGNRNNALVKILCGLLTGVELITVAADAPIDALVGSRPTIVSAPSAWLQPLVHVRPSPLRALLLNRAEFLNSHGIFNPLGKMYATRLRLVYLQDSIFTSAQYNKLKSLLHARIVKETDIRGSMGPLLKTNLFEYRLLGQNQLGVPANSVELKTRDGRLYARGFVLAKHDAMKVDEEMWTDTGLRGFFATDGCFYAS